MRLFLTPVFCALVKFVMAPKLSLWVRTVPPAVLPLLAMMVCGLALVGAWPNLVRRDACDAYGVHGPVERACFGPRRC